LETKPSYFLKRKNAFKYAFKGIAFFFTREAHAKLHLLATILVVTAGVFFHIKAYEWLAIVICIGLVFTAEAFNSSIEILTDSIYKEQHKWAGQIKDIAAGAVLISAIVSIIVAGIIFTPYLLEFYKNNF
jgi:diacylglycerol kinase